MALKKSKIPIIWPPGGHCIFIKIDEIFPERPWDDYVAYGLAIELVRQYGIRTVELSYLGGYLDLQIEKNGNKLPEKMPQNFIRMTVPSYMYHKEHLDYVV